MTTETNGVPAKDGVKPSDRVEIKPPAETTIAGLNLVDLSATLPAPAPARARPAALLDGGTNAGDSPQPVAGAPGAVLGNDGSITFAAAESNSAMSVEKTPAGTDKSREPGVVKDDQGRVTQVNYPNGTCRRFGYAEDGTLNRVVQPDGTTYVLKDGKWEEDTTGKRHAPHADQTSGQGRPSSASGTAVEDKSAPWVSVNVADDGTFTYDTAKGQHVTDLPDGTSDIKDTKTGYMVHLDKDGTVDFVINGRGEMVVVHRDASGKPDKITLDLMHTYHLENGKWVTANGEPAPVENLEIYNDGTVTYVDAATGASVQKRPDGTTIVRQGNGTRIETNARGQVIETESNDLSDKRTFTYDDQGNLIAITDGDGSKIEKDADGQWHDKDGKEIEDVRVEADGTIHYVNDDDKLVTLNTDGSATVTTMDADDIDDLAHRIGVAGDAYSTFKYVELERIKEQMEDMSPADRLALEKAYEARYERKLTDDLKENFGEEDVADIVKDLEIAKLLDDARQRMTDAEYQQFVNDLNKFIQRAKTEGLSDKEVGDTLEAFDKLLTAPQAKLDADQRKLLALQMMGFAADPSSIDQGSHGTCAPNDVEVITWTRHPSSAADLVTQVAIEGKYTATDGHEVAIPPEDLVPEPGSEGRSNTDQRMFASQIFQATALCDIGSRRNPPVYYKIGQRTIDNPDGEYWVDENGKEVGAFNGLNVPDTVDELMRLNDDEAKYFVYSDAWGTRHVVRYENEEEFREELEEAKENGEFPIVIFVCSGDPLFDKSAKPGDAKQHDHVVVIQDYNPETGQVKIDNSWGDEDDKWVDVAALYQATVPYTPPPKPADPKQPAAA